MRDTVHVTEFEGEGPRLLMLPGLGNRGAGFRRLALALATFARPVIVEYPEGRHAAVGADRLARQVIEAVGPVRAAIGSSFGGMVAGYLASQGHLQGVAFISSFTHRRHLGLRGRIFQVMGPLAMVPAPAAILASVAAARLIPGDLAPDVVPTTPGERLGVWHRAFAVPGQSDGVILRDSGVRCVALHGSYDPIVPLSTLRRLVADLPDETPAHVIGRAGHVPYLTHVTQCVEILRPWLADLVDQPLAA